MRSENVFQVIKAICASVAVSLVFVLIFTFIVQIGNLSVEIIKPVNQVFKVVALALGGLLFIRGDGGLVKGLIYGAIAIVVTYFLFSALAGRVNFSWKFFLEVLIGGAAGAISGVIAVNLKK